MSDEKTDTSPDESQEKELDEDQLENVAGGTLPVESISLNYGKVEIKWTPDQSSGEVSGQVPGGYPLEPKKK